MARDARTDMAKDEAPLVPPPGSKAGIIRACAKDMTRVPPSRTLRCYQYVNRPYTSVRTLLHDRPLELLRRATTSAVARTRELASNLRIELDGVELAVAVSMHLRGVHDDEGLAGLSPVTHVTIGWEAARSPSLFPLMSADLSAWPLTSFETQIALEGDYTPPLGMLGIAIDAAVGHRIAEATVHRLLEDVVEQIRLELPATA